jgi:RHS repeat-associated protein
VTEHTRVIDGHTFTTRYRYNGDGELVAKTLPDGTELGYHHRATGRIAAITRDDLIGETTLYGQVEPPIDQPGITGGRLSLAAGPGGGPGAADQPRPVWQARYTDARLTQATARDGTQRGYAYDKAGNRTRLTRGGETVQQADYRPGTNQLTRLTRGEASAAFAYDDAGRVSKVTGPEGERQLTYNARGQLVRVADGDGESVATYAHNAFGERVKKTVKTAQGERTTYFLYEGGRLVAKANGAGEITRQFVHARGRVVALLDGEQAYRVYTDSRGQPTAVTNQAGTEAVWTATTTPFGVAQTNEDPDGDGEAFKLNLRLPGHYYDAETGWHSNHYRTYAPEQGRYLQPDPEGLAAGANRYAYAQNRPLVRIDPDGREPALPRRPDVAPLPAYNGMGARPALPSRPTPQADVTNPTQAVATDDGGSNRTESEGGRPVSPPLTDRIEDLRVWRPGCNDDPDAVETVFEDFYLHGTTGLGKRGTLRRVPWQELWEGARPVVDAPGLISRDLNETEYELLHETVQTVDPGMDQREEKGTVGDQGREPSMAFAINDGIPAEEVRELARDEFGPLLRESELDAFVERATGGGGNTTKKTLINVWPIYERIMTRFETRIRREPEVIDAYQTIIQARNADEPCNKGTESRPRKSPRRCPELAKDEYIETVNDQWNFFSGERELLPEARKEETWDKIQRIAATEMIFEAVGNVVGAGIPRAVRIARRVIDRAGDATRQAARAMGRIGGRTTRRLTQTDIPAPIWNRAEDFTEVSARNADNPGRYARGTGVVSYTLADDGARFTRIIDNKGNKRLVRFEDVVGKDAATIGDELNMPGTPVEVEPLVQPPKGTRMRAGKPAGRPDGPVVYDVEDPLPESAVSARTDIDSVRTAPKGIDRPEGHPLTEGEIAQIRAIPKGERPDPSTYLSNSHIDSVMNEFDDGAAWIVPQETLDNHPPPPVGRPDGQFAMPNDAMNDLLKRTGGDVSKIEKELGIQEGAWKGKELRVIKVDNPGSHNLRVPSGNEGGADPEKWMPGGLTPNGRAEGVLDPVPKGGFSNKNLSEAVSEVK